MKRVLIHPAFRALYYGFYLVGLKRLFPEVRWRPSAKAFPPFGSQCLALEVEGKRVYFAAEDGKPLDERALAWCDVYAKVNVSIDERHPKVLAIGPSFGVRFVPLWRAAPWSVRCYLQARRLVTSKRQHFGEYYHQAATRMPEEAYVPGTSRPDYAFFAASLWKREPMTNAYRAQFVRACKAAGGLQFEGGLALRPDVPGFEDVALPARVTLAEFVRKTQESVVAFNTPAVLGCLGWKLGEYLALGKAILTTPIEGALPAPLEHGTHVHCVDGSVESIGEALDRLRRDGAYRAALERGARAYYDAHLAPEAVVRRVLRRVGVEGL